MLEILSKSSIGAAESGYNTVETLYCDYSILSMVFSNLQRRGSIKIETLLYEPDVIRKSKAIDLFHTVNLKWIVF